MERMTERSESGHAYYPQCFKEPCYGSGCKIKDCQFETAVCDRLAAYEDTGLTPEEIKAPFTEDAIINLAAQALGVEPSRLRELAVADQEGRVTILPCRGDADIVLMRNGVAFKPDHWNIYLTTFAENQPTPSGKIGRASCRERV